MQKMIKIGLCIMIGFCLAGCKKEAVVTPPAKNEQEILTLYLDAMKEQDGVTMAKYTKSGKGDNFKITATDAQALGMSEESASSLVNKLFNFTYTLGEPTWNEDKTQVTIPVSIQTYDVMKIIDDAVTDHKKEFGEIQQSKETDAEKAQKITDILLSSFDNAPLDFTMEHSFTITLIENEWKVEDETINDFYKQLFNGSISQ